MDGGCQSPWALTIAHSSPTNLHTSSTEVFYKSHFKSHLYLYILAYFTHIFVMTNSKTWQIKIKNLFESCHYKLWSETNQTKVCSKNLLIKSSEIFLTFLPVVYLIMWVMKASKNFGKIAILEIWELISLGGVKTHFGKLDLKWCIFRHEKKYFSYII